MGLRIPDLIKFGPDFILSLRLSGIVLEHGKPDSTVVRPLFTDPGKKNEVAATFKYKKNVSGKLDNQVRRYTLPEMTCFGVFADTNVLNTDVPSSVDGIGRRHCPAGAA